MKKTAVYAPHTGDQLRNLVKATSFGGLFLSLTATFFVWAGSDSFHCPAIIWEASLSLNLVFFILAWLVYLPFRNTDRLLGNGMLAALALFSIFWLFGFSMFYFYFLFAPISLWARAVAVVGVTTMIFYRAYLIFCDIREAFEKNVHLFDRMYCDEGTVFTFRREATGFLEKTRRDRNPFKSVHAYAAIFLSPFVFTLNRVLTPFTGDGHGVFLVVAFFSVPMMLWGVGIFVQTIVTMIYYPIKLQQETGKPVLMKDW